MSADIATALGNLVVAFYFSPKLTTIILATSPVSLAILKFLSWKVRPAIQAQQEELAFASKHTTAAITAIDIVKVCNGVEYEISQYSLSLRRTLKHFLTQARISAYQHGFVKLWIECIFVMGFYYGVTLVNDGVSPGNILTTFYSALAALQTIERFVPMYLLLVKGMWAGQELSRIVEDDTTQDGRKLRRMKGTHKPHTCAGDIEIKSVSSVSNPYSLG